jgi:hypothetical protein
MRNVIYFFFFFDSYRKTVLKHNHLVLNQKSFLEECMKKHISRYLLAIVGVVLLTGLIASCGDNEPRFKVIAAKEYTNANFSKVWEELWVKHINGKPALSVAERDTIYNTYQYDVWDLIVPETLKMSSTADGVCLLLKIDQYKLQCNVYYRKDGIRAIGNYYFYNY